MAINKVFMGNSIHKPGYWGGPRVWMLDEVETLIWGMFKTCERLGMSHISCIKDEFSVSFCVGDVCVTDSHEEFKTRFLKK